MSTTGHDATAGQDATADEHQDGKPVYLTLTRPRCPGCNSPRLLAYKSVKNGMADDADDDSLTRYCRCDDCGRRVVVVVE